MKRIVIITALLFSCILLAQKPDTNEYLTSARKYKLEGKYLNSAQLYEKYLSSGDTVCCVDLISILNETGSMFLQSNNPDKAAYYFHRAVNRSRELKSDSLLASSLNKISDVYLEHENNDSALICINEALSIADRINLPSEKAVSLNQLGYINASQGKNEKAVKFFEQSLKISETLNDKKSICSKLSNLGALNRELSKYDKAVKYLEEALVIANELKDEDELSSLYNNMGIIFFDYGEYEKAADNFEKALELDRKLGKTENIATRLNNLGNTYQQLKDYNKALEYYLSVIDTSAGFYKISTAITSMNNIGSLYRIWGQYDKALQYYEKVLAYDKKNNKPPEIAVDLNNIGYVYLITSKYEMAVNRFLEALELSKKGGVNSRTAIILKNLGDASINLGDREKARQYLLEAISILENIRKTIKGNSRRTYLASQMESYSMLLSNYICTNKFYDALSVLEQSSSRYLSDLLRGENSKDSIMLADLVKYKTNLPGKSATICFSNINTKFIHSKFVLTKDTLLALESNSNTLINNIDSSFYKILKSYSPKNSRNLEKIPYGQLINVYKTLLSNPGTGISETKILKKLGVLLYNYIFGDIEELIKDKDELIISPGSNMSGIPFEALIMPDGRYMVEKYDIRYIPSITISEIISSRKYDSPRNSILALGGVIYDSLSYNASDIEPEKYLRSAKTKIYRSLEKSENMKETYTALGYGSFSNLAGSNYEVKIINNIFNDGKIITGENAKESLIKAISEDGSLKSYKIIHFATHALITPELPELSAIVLSPEAGSNKEDGFLRVQEISELKLCADFVNLSACKTAVGKVYSGEGVVGLTQAFLIAGANGLSVSQWEVEDKSTMEFMTGMYRLVKDKSYSFSKALSQMKREFINKNDYNSPFYWAPFVYWGN